MSQSATQFDGGRALALIKNRDPIIGKLMSDIIDALNRTATNAGVSSQGQLPAPPPVDSIAVKGTLSNNILTAPGEILHFVHTHNSPLQRGIHYFTEIDTDPSFSSPHQIHDTTSRSGFVHLPANDDSTAPIAYYLRVTPQLPGSAPQKPTVFGGLQGPTKILMTGSTNMSLLQSQAAGTARPGQGGQGLGAVPRRGAVGGPKRNLGQSSQ
jgi:hypothetical protein